MKFGRKRSKNLFGRENQLGNMEKKGKGKEKKLERKSVKRKGIKEKG